MWTKKNFPLISGYDKLGDNVEAKWWVSQTLDNWLDRAEPLPQFAHVLLRRKDVCDFVIRQFEYPMVRGVPVDAHYNNWFLGKECYAITLDFWQKASETLRTLLLSRQREGPLGLGMGDCEDTSIAFTSLFLENGWQAAECLGAVYQDGQLLGGHGWAIFQDDDGRWRLYESTLDDPPEYPIAYPLIDSSGNHWNVNGLVYTADCKFNHAEYYEWDDRTVSQYLSLAFKAKETRSKYEAIEKAWRKRVKPIKQGGILGKLRWQR